jgi:hypothetical protein
MDKRPLYAIAAALLSGRLIAGEPEMPTAAQISSCSVDPVAKKSTGYFANLRVTCVDVAEFLSGGLAYLESEDGRKVYLVKCCLNLPKEPR